MSVTQCCACLLPIESGETHSLIGCAGGHRIHKDCLRDWQRTDCAPAPGYNKNKSEPRLTLEKKNIEVESGVCDNGTVHHAADG